MATRGRFLEKTFQVSKSILGHFGIFYLFFCTKYFPAKKLCVLFLRIGRFLDVFGYSTKAVHASALKISMIENRPIGNSRWPPGGVFREFFFISLKSILGHFGPKPIFCTN